MDPQRRAKIEAVYHAALGKNAGGEPVALVFKIVTLDDIAHLLASK